MEMVMVMVVMVTVEAMVVVMMMKHSRQDWHPSRTSSGSRLRRPAPRHPGTPPRPPRPQRLVGRALARLPARPAPQPRGEHPHPPARSPPNPSGPGRGHLRQRWAPPPRGPETKAARPLRRRLLLQPPLPGTRRRRGGGDSGEGRRGGAPGCSGPDPAPAPPRPAALRGAVLSRSSARKPPPSHDPLHPPPWPRAISGKCQTLPHLYNSGGAPTDPLAVHAPLLMSNHFMKSKTETWKVKCPKTQGSAPPPPASTAVSAKSSVLQGPSFPAPAPWFPPRRLFHEKGLPHEKRRPARARAGLSCQGSPGVRQVLADAHAHLQDLSGPMPHGRTARHPPLVKVIESVLQQKRDRTCHDFTGECSAEKPGHIFHNFVRDE
uniref:basic proline-rich protein-like n=1 Tax=Odobenus rosmarus divergens TaxID=9708 RepID=UPI00063CF61A|nr:PREDICTED: basic proline-rich protein-like [Odobenus rosmarus divergens]